MQVKGISVPLVLHHGWLTSIYFHLVLHYSLRITRNNQNTCDLNKNGKPPRGRHTCGLVAIRSRLSVRAKPSSTISPRQPFLGPNLSTERRPTQSQSRDSTSGIPPLRPPAHQRRPADTTHCCHISTILAAHGST